MLPSSADYTSAEEAFSIKDSRCSRMYRIVHGISKTVCIPTSEASARTLCVARFVRAKITCGLYLDLRKTVIPSIPGSISSKIRKSGRNSSNCLSVSLPVWQICTSYWEREEESRLVSDSDFIAISIFNSRTPPVYFDKASIAQNRFKGQPRVFERKREFSR